MIESILIDRLIAQVERRTKCEKDHDAVERECAAAKALLAGVKDECSHLRQERDRIAQELSFVVKRDREAKPNLAALYEAADLLCGLLARRKMTLPVGSAMQALRLRLRDAHDACDQIPF